MKWILLFLGALSTLQYLISGNESIMILSAVFLCSGIIINEIKETK